MAVIAEEGPCSCPTSIRAILQHGELEGPINYLIGQIRRVEDERSETQTSCFTKLSFMKAVISARDE